MSVTAGNKNLVLVKMATLFLHIWNSIMRWLCPPFTRFSSNTKFFLVLVKFFLQFFQNDGQDCVQKSTAIGNFERWHCTSLSALLALFSWSRKFVMCVKKLCYVCAKMQVLLVKKYVVDNKQIIDFFAIPHFKTSGVVPDLIHDSNMIQTWFLLEYSKNCLFSWS